MTLPKEAGYILAIDQASNCAGVSLWHNGSLQAWRTLDSASPKDPFGRRLATQVQQLTEFLAEELPAGEEIKVLLFEGVKSSMVLATVGAFCVCPQLQGCKFNPKHSFISALSWKKWARDHGATGPFKEIKGVKALKETGWEFETYPIFSDDVADSLMIYQCWRDRK
jgi:hypothetical protein